MNRNYQMLSNRWKPEKPLAPHPALPISKLKDDNHHGPNNHNNNDHHYCDISPATQERLLQWSLRVRRGFFQLAAWVQCLGRKSHRTWGGREGYWYASYRKPTHFSNMSTILVKWHFPIILLLPFRFSPKTLYISIQILSFVKNDPTFSNKNMLSRVPGESCLTCPCQT